MERTLIDTGPLLAAIDSDDAAHAIAAPLVATLRRRAVIPIPVLVEFDHLASKRVGHWATRSFLKATARGEREISYMSDEVMRRAVEFDSKYADLNIGLVDSCVMAIAERHDLPIFTFDFRDFRATESATGPWRLAIDEQLYQREIQP